MREITVIVPVYKVEKYLRECVDSILSQTFKDYDLVLVDDGSPDDCPKICDEYAEKDNRVTVIHKENGGLSDARNAGIDWAMEHSDSSWLAFVDSDDYLHQDFLQILYTAAVQEPADLIICDFQRVTEGGSPVEESHSFFNNVFDDKYSLFNCLRSNWRIVPAWNKLYSKSIFSELRFEKGKIHEDEYAIHQVLWRCRRAVILNQALYYYRCRQNSIMWEESSSAKLDGLEGTINQLEFCLEHELPLRMLDNASYLRFVRDLKKHLKPEELPRYERLKKRYTRIYFSNPRNRGVKGHLLFYFNQTCWKAYSIVQKIRGKK